MNNDALEALAEVVKKYNLSFDYTKDDDGIHIQCNGVEIFQGFLFSNGNAADVLLAARI
jgi:hypothetical protein